MYSLESNLVGQPIVSLQTGQPVAWAGPPLLDIGSLEVVAITCQNPHHKGTLLLMAQDIRQYATDCIIVDDEEELADPDDIVRLKETVKDAYTPLGKPVVADTGRRLGSVSDYSINLESNRVQKLYIRRPLWRFWSGTNLIIDRTQIIEITNSRIIVRDATMEDPLIATDAMPEI